MKLDRQRAIPAVVVNALDEELQCPPLFAQAERLPHRPEFLQRPTSVGFTDRLPAKASLC
jgi:hypothetical protein